MKPNVTRRGGTTPPNPPRRPATATGGSGGSAARGTDARGFVEGVIAEMKRVTWPSRDEWVAATILTVALVVGVGFFTFGVDWLLAQLFTLLTGGAR